MREGFRCKDEVEDMPEGMRPAATASKQRLGKQT